jgi:type II secretory pathway predicted ATPase ExeA
MYLEHWGLSQPPFRITPDTSQFFSGALRGSILQAVEYAILNGEGIIKVVGEVGTGKTMLCRLLEERLSDNLEIVYLGNPSLSPSDILHAIAMEMGLVLPSDATHLQLIQILHQALLKRHAKGRQVVVFIEEAQGMPIETLEEIRLLSNLETSRHKLLQLVLFGQPELDQNLLLPEIRQLKERITQNFHLPPFSRKDVAAYLHFRMKNVGYRGPEVFRPAAVRAIARSSRGLVRRVSILADKSLLAAFSGGSYLVKARHVRAAIADSEFSRCVSVPVTGGYLRPLLLALGLVVVLSATVWLVSIDGAPLLNLLSSEAIAAEAEPGSE